MYVIKIWFLFIQLNLSGIYVIQLLVGNLDSKFGYENETKLYICVYLKGIEGDEDIGNYYRQMDQDSTKPGQTQYWQQDENWTSHSPATYAKQTFTNHKCIYIM